jgi:hypothetical protein
MNQIIFTDGIKLPFSLLTKSKIIDFHKQIKHRYPDIVLTLFGCTYKSEDYIESYLTNLDSSSIRSNTLVILSIIHRGPVDSIYTNYLSSCKHKNFPTILLVLDSDPGLYNCWNYSIMISPTEYLGNANPDDIRFPLHDQKCIDRLVSDDSHVAASCLYFSSNYNRSWDVNEYTGCNVGFSGSPGNPVLDDLFSIQNNSVKPNNLFHCMPIWRSSIHDMCGYFNEDRYGTYADWALWLQLFSVSPAKASFIDEILGVYLVAPSSHNRTYSGLALFAQNIYSDLLLPIIEYRKKGIIRIHSNSGNAVSNTLICNILDDQFGSHRSDFNVFAADIAAALQTSSKKNESDQQANQEIRIIPFIEKYFGWGCLPGEAGSTQPQPIREPWVGLFHVPFDYPCFIEPLIAPRNILQSKLFRDSIPSLRYLVFLSESMRRRYLQLYQNTRIPTCSIKFYTNHGEPYQVFDWFLFEKYRRVIHVGDWLRCFRSFYLLDCDLEKIILKKDSTNKYMTQLSENLYGGFDWLARPTGSLKSLSEVRGFEYDFLLSSSIVFVRLFDTSANNLVTECIDRCTPIVINRLPAAEEYLGSDYPLFYDSLADAEALLRDMSLLREGHRYLAGLKDSTQLKRENEAILGLVSSRISESLGFSGFSFE